MAVSRALETVSISLEIDTPSEKRYLWMSGTQLLVGCVQSRAAEGEVRAESYRARCLHK